MPNEPVTPSQDAPQVIAAVQDQLPHLLVADDSATIRLALVRSMPDQARVFEAVDGEQAWAVIQERPEIELVITDLDMPRVNGYELLKRIRGSHISRIASMPVIVVTGAEDTKAIAQAFDLGANDFIPKNADKVEIRARVRAHHRLALLIHELEESRQVLNAQANTDALTKLTNRRAFFARATEAIELTRRHRQPFSVLMIDVDHFKSINDTYGHQCGDDVLLQVAQILSNNIRTNDILARIGGEEFAIAAPYSNRLAAVVLAERLRKGVESAEFLFKDTRVPITISVGVVAQDKSAPVGIDQLLARADARLYIAKRRGRNRLCATDSGESIDETTNEEPTGPKLDDALTMIQHGNTQVMLPHLPGLLERTLTFFETANQRLGARFDLERLRQEIEASRAAAQPKPED